VNFQRPEGLSVFLRVGSQPQGCVCDADTKQEAKLRLDSILDYRMLLIIVEVKSVWAKKHGAIFLDTQIWSIDSWMQHNPRRIWAAGPAGPAGRAYFGGGLRIRLGPAKMWRGAVRASKSTVYS
jgi:hypothetical protein